MNPMVSVVVATYRQEQSLISALESLATQTYDSYEIILVDDNDNVEWNQKVQSIVAAFNDKYPEIELTYIENHPNKGSANARNTGIRRAQGRYITFLDDDDFYLPEKITRQVKQMEQEKADYGITDLYLYNEEGKQIDKRVRTYIQQRDEKSLIKYHLKYHMTGTDSMMFKKEYLLKIGCFDSIDLGDEFYLMQKAILGKGKFCYVPYCDIKAYVHVGEVGLSSGKSKIICENQLYEYKKQFFGEIERKSRQYIRMRHYAVLAFAYLRMKKPAQVLKNGILSFIISPYQCCKLILSRRM